MKNKLMAMMAILGVGVISAQASLVVDPNGNQSVLSKTWTISNLGSNPQTVTGVGTDSTPDASSIGTVTSSQVGDSFSFTATGGSNGWSTAAAQSAVGGGTFGTYFATLTADGVVNGQSDGDMGIEDVADDTEIDLGEFMFITFDTSGLDASSTLLFEGISYVTATAKDYADALLYDPNSGDVTVFGWDVKNPDDGMTFASTAVKTGDILILGGAASMTDSAAGYRVGTFTMDVIPEPATLGLVVAFGGGILFIRRRLML